MKLYGIKACDTCRKALKSLEASGKAVEFVDVREAPLGKDDLRRFAEKFGDSLTNTRSTTWRGLSEAERARPQVELLAENPTLMKRPVIEADQLYLGWKKDVQDALL
ncbi:MAG: ArsC/Spx/MgsR family protein [Pseudomonadota bacterium]